MYKPRARGIGILPYALPGVTGLVIGLSVFWFRLIIADPVRCIPDERAETCIAKW